MNDRPTSHVSACAMPPSGACVAEPTRGFRIFDIQRQEHSLTKADRFLPTHFGAISDAEGQLRRDEIARRTPSLFQPLITLIGAIAPSGAEPAVVWTARRIFVATCAWMVVSVATSLAITVPGPSWFWLALPATVISTVGAARSLMTTVLHDLAHTAEHAEGRHEDQRRNRAGFVGEAISFALQTQKFGGTGGYLEEHLTHHDLGEFSESTDPDMVFLSAVGLHPRMGQTVRQLRRRFLATLVSPRFHCLFFKARFMSNFVHGGWRRSVLSSIYWVTVIASVTSAGAWIPFSLSVLLPLGPGVQCAALTQFTSEHRWLGRYASRQAR